ncbi:MAG TPA: VIT1/CCC1 transporter family protein [Candidatus Omnitrophota bacterium]|nr:VIT1/CCC1 transporter family protein [Candidatus Omnitrophota bacterium]
MMKPNSQEQSKTDLHKTHTRSAIRRRLGAGYQHSYLKDFIYGAIDGTVTTFAVVSGVAGAELSGKIVIILGMANLLGDGFSMAVGNFLGTKTEAQQREQARRMEENHIKEVPEGEREEVRQIFSKKGFEGKELERVVDVITSDRKQWIDTMIQEELGLSLGGPSPWRAAFTTFAAFVLIGFLPLVSFVLKLGNPQWILDPFTVSTVLTAFAFFVIGALKARYIGQGWVKAGLETLLIGGCAAALAYTAGVFLKDIVQ